MKPWRTDLADPSYAYRSSVFQGSWGEGIAGVNCRSEGAPITTEGGVSPQFTHKSPFLNLSPTDNLGQRILCSVPGRVWQHSEPLLTRCQKRITTPRCDSYKRFRASQMCPRGKSIPAEKHCSHAEKAVAPTPALLPGKPHGWRSLVGCSPWGLKESDMTERLLSLFTFMHWSKKWPPTPMFLPGESQGWGSLVGCRLWGRTESATTEAT